MTAARHPHPPSLAYNATWQLAPTLVRAAIGLLSVPLYTRLLGMSQWGLLALFQAAIAPLILLDGLGAATVKYVAESAGRLDDDEATRVVQTTLVFNLAVGVAGTLALVASARWLTTSVFVIPPEEVATAIAGFRLIAVNWLLSVVTGTYLAVVVAHQRFSWTARLAALSGVLSAGLGIAVAAWRRDVVAVLLVQTAVAALMAALHFRAAARLLPGLTSPPRWDRAAFRRSFAFGAWQAVGTAGALLVGYSDRYVLGAFFAPAVVGFYAVANLLFGHLQATFEQLSDVLFPAVSHLEGSGDLRSARRLSLLAGWTLTTAFGACAAVMGVVGGDFLHLWVSPAAAAEAGMTLRLLCVGGIVGVASLAPFTYASGIGRVRWDAIASLAGGTIVVGAGLVLVPRHGLPAVGYGLVGAGLLRWAIMPFIWRRHFAAEVSLGSLAAFVYAPALVSIALLLPAAALHDWLGLVPTWPRLVAETALTLVAVVALQAGAGELLPGGPQRRRDVLASFKPIVARALGGRA